MSYSKFARTLLISASLLLATQANADLSLNDRDWASEARAIAVTTQFWEQADKVEQLLRAGKPGEARELLASMQARLQALHQRVDTVTKAAVTGKVQPATW